jgi:hypothetical protein
MPILTDLDVEWVSLVDRAAVRDAEEPSQPQRFLVWKSDTAPSRQPGAVRIAKASELLVPDDAAQQIVYGVVLQPGVADSHGDVVTAAEIEKAAHRYLVQSRKSDVQHNERQADVEIVESGIAPTDMTIADRRVLKGSWVVAAHIVDRELWQRVIKDELTGFSMGGSAVRSVEQITDAPAGRTTTKEDVHMDAYTTAVNRAAELRKADSSLTDAAALKQAMEADPALAARYLAEMRDPEMQRKAAAERLAKADQAAAARAEASRMTVPDLPPAVKAAVARLRKADPGLSEEKALVKAVQEDPDAQLAYMRQMNPRAAAAWEGARR